MKPDIAITGATGFVGNTISHALVNAGYQVRALIRSPEKATALKNAGVKCIQGTLEDIVQLQRLVTDAHAVIHCAGNVRGSRAEHFNRVNVDGTANLFQAIKTSNLHCKVMVFSSLAAREPQLSHYASSKAKMEAWLETHANAIDWMAIRPPAIYGPGDKELLPLFKLMSKGFAPVPGNIQGKFSMIYIDDLVRAVLAWLVETSVVRGVYTIEDGHFGYGWQEVADTVYSITQKPVKLWPIPAALLNSFAIVNRYASQLFGYLPMLTPEKLCELRHNDWVCSNDKISAVLAWQPHMQLLDGLRATSGWQN